MSYGYIKDLMKTLTGFIREDISDISDNITDTQSIAARNYLNYLSQKSLLSDEQMARFKINRGTDLTFLRLQVLISLPSHGM